MVNKLISWILGYCFGCVQSAYIFGRIFKGIDIREHGSGNAGTTNAIRVLGTKIGVSVFIVDALKGVIAFLISYFIFKDNVVALYAGFGAVIGHTFPAQLGFKGGKGVATSLGVLCIFDWQLGRIIVVMAILIIGLSRYVSLGSVVCALTLATLAFFKYSFGEIFFVYFVLVALLVYKHKANIVRLVKGEERKLSFKSKGSKDKVDKEDE
ncbi:MAG: glycerol-3-phosphate 1-O-acyltransferase PlsY [Lachnospirales bacterium]